MSSESGFALPNDRQTTRDLTQRLQVDRTLHRLCGFSSACRLPSEATFSRAFAEFAEGALASRLHEALIARTMKDHLVGISLMAICGPRRRFVLP